MHSNPLQPFDLDHAISDPFQMLDKDHVLFDPFQPFDQDHVQSDPFQPLENNDNASSKQLDDPASDLSKAIAEKEDSPVVVPRSYVKKNHICVC